LLISRLSFKAVIDKKDDYLDLEEDYRDIHEFFTKQIHSWQQLQTGLAHFEKNRQALEKVDAARKALAEMKQISEADAPYGQLRKVANLVETVESVNNRILDEKRSHAQIFMLQTQTAQDDAGTYANNPDNTTTANTASADTAAKHAAVPMPKPVVEVSATKIFNTLASGIYLENPEDVDDFVNALKDELQTAIAAGKRVRLK